MKNLKTKIKNAKHLLNYPYGIDTKWDKQCDDSLLKFLDIVTYGLYVFVFGIPALSMLVLLIQNYGR